MKSLIAIVIGACVATAAWAGAKSDAPAAPRPVVDGEQVYKTNCTRCHNTPPGLSERQAKAVVSHMRVRANLLAVQAEAVRQYPMESAKK
ncbi:MAG TPA: hypothetical protein VGF06_13065 [Terriglobales bacterium]|jgi:mono/diheme cytochrome c family protein